MATFTVEHVSHSRDRYNAKRARTDEQVLADALAQYNSFLRVGPSEPIDEAQAIADERASEASWRLVHAQQAAEIALGCAWHEAQQAAAVPGSNLDLTPDTFTATVTVTDLVATATVTIPDQSPTTPTTKDA